MDWSIRSLSKSISSCAIDSVTQILHWIYPPLCLHCEDLLQKPRKFFCAPCLEQLELLETRGRCPSCFGESYSEACQFCVKRFSPISSQVAVFERIGPVHSFLQRLQKGGPGAIVAAGALMAYQWLIKGKELPDCLVPLPVPFLDRLFISPVHLKLSQEIGRLFAVPVVDVLQAEYNHLFFMKNKKKQLKISMKNRESFSIADQRVLLISTELDFPLLEEAAFALRQAYPARIDSLAFFYSPS